MSLDKIGGNNYETSYGNNNQNEQLDISGVRESIKISKEYSEAGDIESQVGPILEGVFMQEGIENIDETIENIVETLMHSSKSEREKQIQHLISMTKHGLPYSYIVQWGKGLSIKYNKDQWEKQKTEKVGIQTEKVGIQTERERIQTEREQTQQADKREIDTLPNSLENLQILSKQLSGKPEYKRYKEVLQKYKGVKLTFENRYEFLGELKQSLTPDTLVAISQEIGVKSPQYKSFKNSLISIEGSNGGYFRTQFEIIERVGPQQAKHYADIGISEETPIKQEGEKTICEKGDINIVLDKKGNRNICLPGKEYNLPSEINTKTPKQEIDEISSKHQETIEPLNTELGVLRELEKFMSDNPNLLINELKNAIKINFGDQMNINQIESLSSKEDILRYITNRKYILETKKKEKIQETNQRIQAVLDANARKAETIDRQKKKVLEFLHDIGFDAIPQSITDDIIKRINSSPVLKSQLGFNSFIELANGNLGIDKDHNISEISFAEKKLFVEFLNRMITGDKAIPNYMTSGGEMQFYASKKDLENGKLSTLIDKNSFINHRLGSNPSVTILKNLGIA